MFEESWKHTLATKKEQIINDPVKRERGQQ